MRVAWIGLGVMGYPMAGHLVKSGGHEVTVYNRTAAKAEKWVEQFKRPRRADARRGGRRMPISFSPASATTTTCAQVTIGPDGAFAAMKPGAVFIDHTTASAERRARTSRRRARPRASASSMRRCRADRRARRTASLTVMCGGDAADYAQGRAGDRAFLAHA